MTSEALAAAVETLYVGTIDTKPVNVDSWSDLFYPEDGGGERADYWQAFSYTLDRTGQEFTLVAHGSSVHGVYVDGTMYDEWADYDADHPSEAESTQEASMEEQFGLSEEDFAELMELAPYQYGSEGPMMNYWYPLDHGSIDPAEVAAKIEHTSLCVVEVDDTYGLALAGGGMDFSWEICHAFILAGFLPPAHFADLPRMACITDRLGETQRLVLAGMRRSLTIRSEWAQSALSRLDDVEAWYAERGTA